MKYGPKVQDAPEHNIPSLTAWPLLCPYWFEQQVGEGGEAEVTHRGASDLRALHGHGLFASPSGAKGVVCSSNVIMGTKSFTTAELVACKSDGSMVSLELG